MSSAKNTSEAVSIRILDRDYTIGVSQEERASLLTAARALDERMREIRSANRIAPMEQIAVLAALHLAHELETQGNITLNSNQRIHQALDALELRMNFLERTDTPR
ncbi:cell division protein ZapA [Lysobacteraceae bacterium NML07-0707]|nr:cell division protein ZapA [Xanthomonadaceae bacterium NML07-0707]